MQRKDDYISIKNKVNKIVYAVTIVTFLIPCMFAVTAIDSTTIADNNVAYATKDEISSTEETKYIAPTTTIVTTEPSSITEPITEKTTDNVESNIYNTEQTKTNIIHNEISEYELDLLARTIYQEAGVCGEHCQWLVGSTVLNLADERGGIEAVVFDYNTFNVAYVLYNATPSDLSYSVARRVLAGDRDYSVKAFRTDYYHNFGTPYTSVDNVYFSTY